MAQDVPNMAQGGPKMAPIQPNMAPNSFQDTQNDPHIAQDGPKMASSWLPDGFKMATIPPSQSIRNHTQKAITKRVGGSGVSPSIKNPDFANFENHLKRY
jgi:hypothetical protein